MPFLRYLQGFPLPILQDLQPFPFESYGFVVAIGCAGIFERCRFCFIVDRFQIRRRCFSECDGNRDTFPLNSQPFKVTRGGG